MRSNEAFERVGLRAHMNIDLQEFDQFCSFLKEACGICLAPNKQYLVSTRIKRLLSENEVPSIKALLKDLEDGRRSTLRDKVIDAMTTNETYWFRDAHPFNYLKNTLLRDLISSTPDGGEIRIWCAACSSGQEPYSIAIIADELQREMYSAGRKSIKILATEISKSMLQVAEDGVYDKVSVLRGLSQDRLDRYFEPVTEKRDYDKSLLPGRDKFGLKYNVPNENQQQQQDAEKEHKSSERWRVKASVRDRVEYRFHNMLDTYSGLGRFDIIFCRNVLIYFSAELKREILKRLRASLKPGGYLYLGSSEGLGDSMDLFDMVQCNPGIVYRAR